jgi:hypothetical protein
MTLRQYLNSKEQSVTVRITHIRLSSGVRDHKHITDVQWVNQEDSSQTGTSTVPVVVEWIDKGGKAFSGTGSSSVPVGVVRETAETPYLRTYADSKWNNNLLSLDTF